jgi:hypothetical protein
MPAGLPIGGYLFLVDKALIEMHEAVFLSDGWRALPRRFGAHESDPVPSTTSTVLSITASKNGTTGPTDDSFAYL